MGDGLLTTMFLTFNVKLLSLSKTAEILKMFFISDLHQWGALFGWVALFFFYVINAADINAILDSELAPCVLQRLLVVRLIRRDRKQINNIISLVVNEFVMFFFNTFSHGTGS
jgi:hypothetical protein